MAFSLVELALVVIGVLMMLKPQTAKAAPLAPSSLPDFSRPPTESAFIGTGGFDCANASLPEDVFAALRATPVIPGPPPVGGPGSFIAEGGPAEAGCAEE